MIKQTFQEITTRLDGCQAIALVGMDGILIETLPVEDDVNLDLLAAEYAAVVKGARDAQKECGDGDLQELMFTSDRSVVLSRCLNGEYFLILSLHRDGNLGKARFEMKKAGGRILSELEN